MWYITWTESYIYVYKIPQHSLLLPYCFHKLYIARSSWDLEGTGKRENKVEKEENAR